MSFPKYFFSLGVTLAAVAFSANADDSGASDAKNGAAVENEASSDSKDRTIAAEAGVSPETDRFMKEAGGQVEKIFQPERNSAKDATR